MHIRIYTCIPVSALMNIFAMDFWQIQVLRLYPLCLNDFMKEYSSDPEEITKGQ